MRAPLAATAALLLATPATAHEPIVTHAPPIAEVWRLLDAPEPGEGRVRWVRQGDHVALMNVDQFWHYERAYEAALARLSFRMPVHSAIPRARAEAWHAVTRVTRGTRGPILVKRVSE